MSFFRGGGRGRWDGARPETRWPVIKLRIPDLHRPLLIVVVLLALWVFLTLAPRLYTDYRWFEQLGFSAILVTAWTARLAVFSIFGAFFFGFYLLNITIARRLTPRVADESSRWSRVVAFAGRSVNRLLIAIGLFLAVVVGLVAQTEWLSLLRFWHATPFETRDPIFLKDVSFYVFQLPVYEFVVAWLGGALLLSLLAVAVTYALGLGRLRWTPAVQGHISALGVGVLLLSAWNYQLQAFNLAYSRRGVVAGPSYTDVNVQWPAYNVLTFIALALAVLLLVNIFVRTVKVMGLAVALWLAAWVLLGQSYPEFVQSFEVKPSEFTKEQPYILNNIQSTRQAFGLDRIQERAFSVADTPTVAAIQSNRDTVYNIRLWDYRPLQQTYNQIQTIRTYYDFLDVDIDRYTIDGQYRQVMLSARELSPQKLTEKAQTWVNLHLLYTHGYGAVMSPVNESTLDGLPNLLVRDIPPIGQVPITRPEIYFGQETGRYVFVRTKEKEFDYPQGDNNVFAQYAGNGGVAIGSYFDRLMFSLLFADQNILLTDALTADSRVMFNRAIQPRLQTIASFLQLDHDPYLVVADGHLYWMQDAYTTSDRYPNSEPHTSGLNYIRNSVKIVTDAYDGSITFYATDPGEPILRSYRSIFPALFRPLEEMPPSLRAHLRYPEDLVSIQADMYQTYHMQDPQVFYNKEDLWAVPNEIYDGKPQQMEPYYVIMRLAGETREEFMILLPFTPAKRQNLVAWLSFKSDGADYGQALVYRFPKDKLVYGPEQIWARVNQDPVISPQLSLVSQRGSRIVYGNLLVIPIETSLLYVQPLYLLAEQSQIPQLKYVIVATGTSLTMQPTLGEAVAQLFSGAGPYATGSGSPAGASAIAPNSSPNPGVLNLVRQANDHYGKAQEALKIADWDTYGKEMQRLEQALNQLVQEAGSGK